MNVEIGTEAAQFLFWDYINSNFFAVFVCVTASVTGKVLFCIVEYPLKDLFSCLHITYSVRQKSSRMVSRIFLGTPKYITAMTIRVKSYQNVC